MSRIGKKPITLPEKVKFDSKPDGFVQVEGPKGKLSWKLPKEVTAKMEDNAIVLERSGETSREKAMHGLSRSLINNMVIGVSDGFVKDLEIHGVGFRAAVKGEVLNLSLGFSHPVNFPIPEGIKVTVADNTKVKIEGIDKEQVGQVAADIRRYYPPEPYKGKGIRFAGENIRRKEGKTVQ